MISKDKQLKWLKEKLSPMLERDVYGFVKVHIMGGQIVRIEKSISEKPPGSKDGIGTRLDEKTQKKSRAN